MDYLKCIESFISATESGSFTAAADKLGITPAMVGKHIQMLEKRTGCVLINRTTRRQGLTEAGHRFYLYGVQILATVEDADSLARHLNEEVTGLLRISAPVSFGQRILTPILSTFLQRYPAVNACLVLSDRRVDMIEERFQIAIRIGSLQDEGYIALPLPAYEMLLAASPAYLDKHGTPVTPADLSAHNCISFSQWRADHLWPLNGPQGLVDAQVSPRLTVDSGEAIRQAALSGLGIVMHSRVVLQEDIDAGRLCRVLPDYAPVSRPMHLLRLPNRPAPLVSAFSEHFMEELAKPANAPEPY
ncbi:LysR family transcriptional regulator [Rahnella variigena]|uniref:LysR family transcriptional regulator n=1 Tax=Rahnella variigena TaxID=574964 RepID=UPI00244ACBB0|nr:LysR family transcriptional regulator [Rahnella variigena]MDH2896474.1 LysR family transcriptional regulator [Rahnella variigena]